MPITSYVKHTAPSPIDVVRLNIIDNGDGTVTIAPNQTFRIQDVLFNTADFSLADRTFSIDLGETCQIRFSLNGNPLYSFGANVAAHPSPRSFYKVDISNFGNFTPSTPDDLIVGLVHRDATTGVLSFSSATINSDLDFEYSCGQYVFDQNQTAVRPIVIDAVNGNDSNDGYTLATAVQTIDKAAELASPYQASQFYLAPGTYTATKVNGTKSLYIQALDFSNPPTININVDRWIRLHGMCRFRFSYVNLVVNNLAICGWGGGASSLVGMDHCTITLNNYFITEYDWCYSVIDLSLCTIIKPSTYLFAKTTAVALNFESCTIKDGAGNTLQPTDVVQVIRDTTGTIRNFLSTTIL